MFALFEDDLTIILGTAGFAAFGSSTSGYGYSPPSATLSRDDNQLKMCLLCTCESTEALYGGKDKRLLQTLVKDFKKNGRVLVDLLSSESSLFHFFSDGRIVLEFILYLFQQFLLRIFFSFGINFFILK